MDGGNLTKVEAAEREDRTKMKKEARRLRCTLLNESTWSTETKYMRRYKGKCDIFFGIERYGEAFQQRSQGMMEVCG